MINLLEYLYLKVKPIIESWDEEGIYAISFFVHTNEAYDNIPIFAISYNTEEDCNHSPLLSEERWNYAFWRQDEKEIIGDEESTNILLQWYEENNIKNIGQEDEDLMYDDDNYYIGKGPNGTYELIQVISDLSKRLHDEGFIANTFKKEIPIIIHDLEYPWYELEATKKGNPEGLVDMFLKSINTFLS
ncbi:MAG: hypothetical protein AB7V48_17140 [Sedimentibacter sp.]